MFNIPEIINVGPFVLPLHYVLFAIIAASAIYFIYLKSKTLGVSHETWVGILLNGLTAYVLVWKFSFILLDPLSILKNPSMIIFETGGFFGNILGIIVGLIIAIKSAKKLNYSPYLFMDLLMFWLLITLTVYWTITPSYGIPTTMPWGIGFENSIKVYHPTHWYTLLLGTLILLYLKMKKACFGRGEYASFSLFLFGLGLLIISNFTYQRDAFFGFSPLQWLYLSMTIIGLITFFEINKRNHRDESS